MVNTINSKTDLTFAGSWLSSTFKSNPLLTKRKKTKLMISNLRQDIVNLQNSTDIKLLEQTQKKNKELEKLLNDTVALLGKEEVKNLGDIRNLLQGRSLKELVEQLTLYQQKVGDQDTALLNLARQKIKGQKEAETLLNELETNFSEKEIEWEAKGKQVKEQHEKEREQWAGELAREKGARQEEIKLLKKNITNLEQEKKDLAQQTKTLTESNEKLNREKNSLVLDKNNLNIQLKAEQNLRKKAYDELVEVKETVKELNTKNQTLDKENAKLDKQQKEWYKADFPGKIRNLEYEWQEQLKRINVLFDPEATNYEKIDFNGLYALLVRFKDGVEREREQKELMGEIKNPKKAGSSSKKKK